MDQDPQPTLDVQQRMKDAWQEVAEAALQSPITILDGTEQQ